MSRLKNSLRSYKMSSFVEFIRLYRSKSKNAVANGGDSDVVLAVAKPRISSNAFPCMQLAGVRFVHAAKAAAASSSGIVSDEKPTPTPKPPSARPPSRRGGFPMWAKLVLGSVISLFVAFWTPKWATLLKIGGEAEMVMTEVEHAAEVVQKVATVVEKVSEEMADVLPDGNKFKEAALIIEHVSEEAAKDAHIAEEILHKVDAAKQDLEDVKDILEPIIDKNRHDAESNKALDR